MIKFQRINVKNLLTTSKIPASDYVVNPYVGCLHACKYCYATFMRRFTNHHEPWGQFLDVKCCRKPINVIKLKNKSVNLSSVTDPYMNIENKYKITRNVLEQLVCVNCKVSILTKGILALRDIDLFKQMENVQVTFSINTLDENFKNDMDKASSIKDRIDALKTLHMHKIHNGLFISPIFPEITDWKQIILKTKSFVDEYWFENLNLRANYKSIIMKYIRNKYPQYIDLYEQIYIKKNNIYWNQMSLEIEKFCKTHNVKFINYFYHEKIRKK